MSEPTDTLVERYLGLESIDVQEQLLDVCGSRIDERALPILKRRIEEAHAAATWYTARGYVRMAEKADQLADAVRPLIVAFEGMVP